MSRRRYKVGKFPAYDRRFDLQKGKSPILNQRGADLGFTSLLQSEEGLRQLLREWAGDTKEGLFEDLKTGRVVPSHMKDAEDELAMVDQRFEDLKAMAVRSGRYAPEQMPPELVEEQLEAQARLDIVLEECDWIKKELAKYTKWKKEADDSQVLLHGPMGTTQGADPPRFVDGQVVKRDKEQGHFLIDCEKSPYHGMKVPDYYAFVCKPWREARNAAYAEACKKANDLESTEGERKRWAEKAHRILRNPLQFVPWPKRPME